MAGRWGMSKNSKKFLILLVILAAGYYGYKHYRYRLMEYIPPSILPESGRSSEIIYDTDPQNDRFIKGVLTTNQFRVLDKILDEEERNGGMRVNTGKVRQLAREDKAVIEAYDRWRRCGSLMRSENYVVYPSQRHQAAGR